MTEAEGGLDTIFAARLNQAMTRPGLSGAVLMDRSDDAEGRLGYFAEAAQVMREQSPTQVEALIADGLIRQTNPVALAALALALACLASIDLALRTFLDIDITDEGQRDALVDDIVDVISHGVLPGTDTRVVESLRALSTPVPACSVGYPTERTGQAVASPEIPVAISGSSNRCGPGRTRTCDQGIMSPLL